MKTEAEKRELLLQWCAAFAERGIKPTGDDGLFLCDKYIELAEENARLREAVEAAVEWFDAEDITRPAPSTTGSHSPSSQTTLCRRALRRWVAER